MPDDNHTPPTAPPYSFSLISGLTTAEAFFWQVFSIVVGKEVASNSHHVPRGQEGTSASLSFSFSKSLYPFCGLLQWKYRVRLPYVWGQSYANYLMQICIYLWHAKPADDLTLSVLVTKPSPTKRSFRHFINCSFGDFVIHTKDVQRKWGGEGDQGTFCQKGFE